MVLDENALAAGHEYSAVSCHEPSPDHTLLAYAVDHNGYETYSLQIKDIATGRVLSDVLEETSGDAVWGADSTTLFYLKMDAEHRPDRCYLHVLGTPQVEHSPCRSPPGALPLALSLPSLPPSWPTHPIPPPPQADDVLVLSEPDSRFWMGLDRTASDRFLIVGVESKETSEHYLVDLQGVAGGAAHAAAARRKALIHPRRQG